MISLYTGSVGSGKSYHATALGLQWIRRKHVIANFPITDKRAPGRWIFQESITVEFLIKMSITKKWFGKESQCLVIFDEAGIEFNSRDWNSKPSHRMQWIKFLSQSRKFGYDFVFVCQSDKMIDRQIRGLVEYEVKHLKANQSFMFRFLDLFRITAFLYVYRWYHTRLKSNVRLDIYKPWIAKKYDTMRTFDLSFLDSFAKEISAAGSGEEPAGRGPEPIAAPPRKMLEKMKSMLVRLYDMGYNCNKRVKGLMPNVRKKSDQSEPGVEKSHTGHEGD